MIVDSVSTFVAPSGRLMPVVVIGILLLVLPGRL